MEGQLSEVRSVEQLNAITESENEYFDSFSDLEPDEDIYSYEETDSSESDKMENGDKIQPTKYKDKLPTEFEETEYKHSISVSKSKGRESPIRGRIGPSGRNGAENVNNPLEAWSMLLTDEILNTIVRYTNEEIVRRRKVLNSAQKDNYLHADLSLAEFKALLGLLYFSGLYNITYTNTIDLWSSFSLPVYRATMPRDRFVFLMTCIRFDDEATRRARCKEDKYSPIREIFDKFVGNCKKYYTPHDSCTVGKIVVPCLESCMSCKFAPEGRGAHGIKILMMNDAKTFYMINASLHIGKIETEVHETIHSYYLKTLTQPVHGSGRNVICSINWPLYTHVMKTFKKYYNLTLVSTVEEDDPEIRHKFCSLPARRGKLMKRLNSGILLPYYHNGCHLGILQSSLPVLAKKTPISELKEVLQDTRQFYELTENVAVTFDELSRMYSTIRATRRWPLRFFFTILDQ